MKTVAFYNIKGGVGKTTSAVNIAYSAAQANIKTILWDLDSQSCASWYLGVDDARHFKIMKVFKGKEPIGKLRLASAFDQLEIIPSDLSLSKLELLLNQPDNRKLLGKLTDHLSENTKLLIFDCSPEHSKVSEAIFNCADVLAVPLIPSPLSLRAYSQLKSVLAEKKQWRQLSLLPFFTMVDRRRKIHNEVIEQAKQLIDDDDPIVIPYASELERMGIQRQPVGAFAGSSKAAIAYEQLWQRLLEQHNLS